MTLTPTLIEAYVRHATSLMEKDEVVDRLVDAEKLLSRYRDRIARLEASR